MNPEHSRQMRTDGSSFVSRVITVSCGTGHMIYNALAASFVSHQQIGTVKI